MPDFLTCWTHFHPDQFPLMHVLRETSSENWTRFHSLPGSKRYSEDTHEASIILHRMKMLGDEVLGENAECFLVLAEPLPFPEDESEPSTIETIDLDVTDPEMARHFDLMEARWHDLISDTIRDYALTLDWTFPFPDDECDYQVYAGSTHWPDEKDVNLLRQIADDEIDRIFWMSKSTGAIFAPYDGGVDLILPDVLDITRLGTKYRNWRSAHPLGL